MSLKSGKYLFQCSFVVVIDYCDMEVKCKHKLLILFFFHLPHISFS